MVHKVKVTLETKASQVTQSFSHVQVYTHTNRYILTVYTI